MTRSFDCALEARSPEVARTVWGRSLREGAAVLVVRGDRIALPFKVNADPVEPSDLPIATGAGAPQANGSGPVVAAVRSADQVRPNGHP